MLHNLERIFAVVFVFPSWKLIPLFFPQYIIINTLLFMYLHFQHLHIVVFIQICLQKFQQVSLCSQQLLEGVCCG